MKPRREFLKMAGAGVAGAVAMGAPSGIRAMAEEPSAIAQQNGSVGAPAHPAIFEAKAFGAKGDGNAIDTPAISLA